LPRIPEGDTEGVREIAHPRNGHWPANKYIDVQVIIVGWKNSLYETSKKSYHSEPEDDIDESVLGEPFKSFKHGSIPFDRRARQAELLSLLRSFLQPIS
jgi:hypothetical protein